MRNKTQWPKKDKRPLVNALVEERPKKKPPKLVLRRIPVTDRAVKRADGSDSPITLPIQFVKAVDRFPRDVVREALIQDDTPRSLRLYDLLCDPKNEKLPVSELAMRCGIRVTEMMEIWRSHMRISALGSALKHVIDVTNDCARDARSVEVCCTRCDGAAMIRVTSMTGEEWITCPTCNGTRKEWRPGDRNARQYLLQMAGMIHAQTAPVVNVNLHNSGVASVIDELEQLDRHDRTVDITPVPNK